MMKFCEFEGGGVVEGVFRPDFDGGGGSRWPDFEGGGSR